MKAWLDVVHGIAWEPSWHAVAGPVYLVSGEAEQELVESLTALGFEVFLLDAGAIRDRAGLFDVIARAFSFPDYFGKNWDAFDDSFGEFCDARQKPLAIVWRNADSLCDHALREFLETIVMFALAAESAERRPDPLQIEVFWLGSTQRGYVAKPRGLRSQAR
jgi:RNAse (barnase) inhibitor barstar